MAGQQNMELNWENSTPKHLEAPTRRRWRDFLARGWLGGEGDEGESCQSRFLTFPEICYTPRGESEFEKTIPTNAFIDSYYPKLQSDLSEDGDEGGKCFCGSSEMMAGFCVGDSSECSNIYVVSMAMSNKSSECSLEFWEGETLEVPDTRSKTTLGTKTYTLLSNSSIVDSIAAPKLIEKNTPQKVETPAKEEEGQFPKKVSPTDECFSRLLVRIDALEALLQQTLVSGCPKPCESELTELKDNFDTDNELRNIKERVNALEKKLRESAMRRYKETHSDREDKKQEVHFSTLDVKSCSEVKETSTTNSNLTPVTGGRSRSRSQVTPTESDSAALRSPKSEKAINQLPEKKRTKARKKSIPKSRRIRRILSSVLHSSGKYSTADSVQLEMSECCGTKDSLDKMLPRPETEGEEPNLTVVFVKPGKRGKMTGKKRKELCRKPPVINFAPNKDKSKKHKKRHKGNNTMEQQEEERPKILSSKESEETPVASSSAERNRCCRVHFLCKRCPPVICHGCPHWRNNTEVKKSKTRKKLFPNPIDILRRGGQIKIPVLFKEVCKVQAPANSQKPSNISIRFIPVSEAKQPFKNLLKKLPLSHESEIKYTCGGAKCCCNSQIPKVSPNCCGRKKGPKIVTCN